jgi:hypothetical protein
MNNRNAISKLGNMLFVIILQKFEKHIKAMKSVQNRQRRVGINLNIKVMIKLKTIFLMNLVAIL